MTIDLTYWAHILLYILPLLIFLAIVGQTLYVIYLFYRKHPSNEEAIKIIENTVELFAVYIVALILTMLMWYFVL